MGDERVSDLKAKKIENGTVIDHIKAGHAPQLLRILGFEKPQDPVIILVNMDSKTLGKKDIIKIENKVLNEEKINRIALVSPEATINIVKNFTVRKKLKAHLPDVIKAIAKCPNRNCISNFEAVPTFHVQDKRGQNFRCHYCERLLGTEELIL